MSLGAGSLSLGVWQDFLSVIVLWGSRDRAPWPLVKGLLWSGRSCDKAIVVPSEDPRERRGAGTRPDEQCPPSELSQGKAGRVSGIGGLLLLL